MTTPALTIAITTRDRPDSLRRCVRSLQHLAHLAPEILVFDDASQEPAAAQLGDLAQESGVRVIRHERGVGVVGGRNRLVASAASPFVLLLDDDAAVLGRVAVESGLALMARDPDVAAVAFAQARADGTPWPESMQPARSRSPSVIPAFIGFAHLVRRELFRAVGGYRERLVFYGEEKELCVRLMDAGYRVVFLPSAFVMHDPDPAGRSSKRYLRQVVRNDCLNAMYNEPLHRVLWLVPARLALYFVMRREWKIADPLGCLWIVGELMANAGPVLRERRPVRPDTRRRWAALRKQPEAYEMPAAARPL
jgi:GT2 family glycosyltransferase